jgi:hypothetical protein
MQLGVLEPTLKSNSEVETRGTRATGRGFLQVARFQPGPVTCMGFANLR